MPVTPPVTPENANDGVKKIYSRIAETIGNGQVQLGYQMMGNVESYVQDSYMNYKKFIHEGKGKLEPKTRQAIALATCSAMNCTHCVRHHAKEMIDEQAWTSQEIAEVLAVTASCSMYNTLFKFRDLAHDPTFEAMPVELRAFTFKKTSLGETLTELINTVVSNINGCEKCTSSHVKKLLQIGVTHEQIDEAIKISATMASFNVFHRTQ